MDMMCQWTAKMLMGDWSGSIEYDWAVLAGGRVLFLMLLYVVVALT
jgi:hypothetical protein